MLTMLALAAATNAAPICTGADPAFTSVVQTATQSGDVQHFTLSITVGNLGSKRQPSNTLQSVVIIVDGTKTGEKGIPPLAPGKTYSFTYDVQRATDTEPGSTHVRLHIVQHNQTGPSADCNTSNDLYRIDV